MGWVKPVQVLYDSCFFSFGNGVSSDNVYLCLAYLLNNVSHGPYFGVWNGTSTVALIGVAQPITANAWTHLSATWDEKNAIIYVNGALAYNATGYGGIRNVIRNECYIGMNNWPGYPLLNAYVDDIRIYNRYVS